nr:MAG TPA: hypothetical protein [Caudoviricetes sp.]
MTYCLISEILSLPAGRRAAERNLPRYRVSRGSTHQRPRLSGRDGQKCEVSRHSRTLPCQ